MKKKVPKSMNVETTNLTDNIPCESSTTDLINHISFIIDASGSMSGLKEDVIKVFDAQVKRLAQKSVETNQETRVSIYLFNYDIECIVFDKDVLRLPSLADRYKPDGGTALLDAMMKSILDFEKLSFGYGNHACLSFIITDGEENGSQYVTASTMSNKLNNLPNNFTVACLLPNAACAHEAKKYGISAQNISIWDTTSATGIIEAGNNIHKATDIFFDNRAAGISTKNLFKLDTSNLDNATIQNNLQEVDKNTYTIYQVDADSSIKSFIENTGNPYTKGCASYLLTKKELVQSNKKICIRERSTNKIYSGNNARTLLKLPLDQDVDVRPDNNNLFDIFIESTSVNRKILSGTSLLYFK